MTIPLGLSSANKTAYLAQLVTHHSVNVTVQVLDLDSNRLTDISALVVDGQVDIDSTADVTRQLTLSLSDPSRSIEFDSNGASDTALYMDRMIRVVYSVRVGAGWVDCPVFTGPVSKLERTDEVVNLEAQGKEVLAMGQAWDPLTLRKGHNRVDAIRLIMAERTGETKFSLPETTQRLRIDRSLSRQSIPWTDAKVIARGLGMQLFYDGRGTLRLRPRDPNPVFVFRSGDGGSVLTAPDVTYSLSSVKNVVWVRGGVPKGQKRQIEYIAMAPRSHPLSPWALGRHNSAGTLVPNYLVDVIDNSSLRSTAEAKTVATTQLTHSLLEQIDVTFDALPLPFLEPEDVCRVETSDVSVAFHLKQLSLPLKVGNNMTIGYTKRLSTHRMPRAKARKKTTR